jgi:hypothetical protein
VTVCSEISAHIKSLVDEEPGSKGKARTLSEAQDVAL